MEKQVLLKYFTVNNCEVVQQPALLFDCIYSGVGGKSSNESETVLKKTKQVEPSNIYNSVQTVFRI